MHGDTESLTPKVKAVVDAEMKRLNGAESEGGDKKPDISLEEAIRKAWETVVCQHGLW